MDEMRRRAYLQAMQVDCWYTRVPLPFSAPSNPDLYLFLADVDKPDVFSAPAQQIETLSIDPLLAFKRIQIPPAADVQVSDAVKPAIRVPSEADTFTISPVDPPPRFCLQLLQAGNCLLLTDLPDGIAFQSRDPAYLLLRDLLRAAGLPDNPRVLGDPVAWPLLQQEDIDQGSGAAQAFVQSYVEAQRERAGVVSSLWLIGEAALRYAGEAGVESLYRELALERLGNAWALPGLEALAENPHYKVLLWRAMRRVSTRWRV